MGEKDLENIIILLLVIVIIYMIYRRNEKLTVDQNTQSVQNKINELQNQLQEQTQQIQRIESVPVLKVENKQENKQEIKPIETKSADQVKCENVKTNQFLDEYMNYSRFGNKIEKITTDEEINAYRKSFLDFRNVTNQTSHGFDPVDQMNLDKISGLYKGGLKIHEVYDKIAAKNFDTSKIDLYNMQLNERIDDTIRSNTFEYDNDEVNNGGFFFEKIKANDDGNNLRAFP